MKVHKDQIIQELLYPKNEKLFDMRIATKADLLIHYRQYRNIIYELKNGMLDVQNILNLQ
jgi:hypothetical protein